MNVLEWRTAFTRLWNFPNIGAQRPSITAAAQVVQGPNAEKDLNTGRQLYQTPAEWQREVWDFYDELGEFRQGVTWKANLLSRVRLRAARRVKGQDDPEFIDSGPAFDLVEQLAGGVGGQANLMSSFGVHLDVPGECFLIGETKADGTNRWYTRSIEEVRPSVSAIGGYAITERAGVWRDLPNSSLVVRVYRAHKRWHWLADSPARGARALMRELELINRHIQAQYLSRLASAGIIVFPDDITFPTRPEFQDLPDPFVGEWIEIAAEAIKTPGTAASVIPIPIRVPGEYIEKIKLVDFTLKLDDKIIEKRDSALARLAIELDMPPEALLGTRDVNHWSAWLIDEQGVKIHVSPTAEVICDALTIGYLHPMLKSMGEPVDDVIIWYDASELILRPDKSAAAKDAYDRVELSGATLRSELGFNESDAPDEEETKRILLIKAAMQPVNTFAALAELGYEMTQDPSTRTRPEEDMPPENKPAVEPGPPPDPSPPPARPTGKASSSITEALMHQAQLMHAIEVRFDGVTLLHPPACKEHLFSCPVGHATFKPNSIPTTPGTSGIYRCWLNPAGVPLVGERIYNGDAASFIPAGAVR